MHLVNLIENNQENKNGVRLKKIEQRLEKVLVKLNKIVHLKTHLVQDEKG